MISKSQKQIPEVLFQPHVARGFQGGIQKIVSSIRPSFGPHSRTVAIEREIGADRSPELLDSGGIIARRILELPDPDENAGAMFIRGALWSMHERVGDGVATAAILFESVFDQGLKYIAAGGNAIILRRYLEKGMALIVEALDDMVVSIEGVEALTGVAKTVCHDHEMAAALGNIISIIGEYGILDIRAGHGRGLERELIAGSYWSSPLVSKKMITDPFKNRSVFENAALLITDLEIEDPRDLVPVIRTAVDAQINRLVIMCSQASEPVQGLIFQTKDAKKLQMLMVKAPSIRADVRMGHMMDIAVMTGGKTLLKAAGDTLESVTAAHFGYARRIWANMDYMGLVHPQGDPKEIRKHINNLRNAISNITKSEERDFLQERIGKLLGGAAALEVGGLTETEMETRMEMAKRTTESLRGAARDGILPGGGSALLACRPALDAILQEEDAVDARAAHRILSQTLEVPFRTLVSNSGGQTGKILSEVERAEPGFGYDLVSGQVCEMLPNGILDVATVQKQAVISAIRSAAMALTIDVLVHRKKQPIVTDPDAPGI
jgi:chaperonin GroEL